MAKNTVTLDVPQEAISILQPNIFVPEKLKTREWFRNIARYYCKSYNPQSYIFDTFGSPNTNSGTDYSNWNMRLADEFVNNLAYLFGQQPNINYKFMTTDVTGKTFQNPWIKGRNAGKIVDFANGDMLNALDNITFDAISLSKDVIAKKNDLFSKIELAYELKDHMRGLEQLGVKFQPYNKEFEMEEDISAEKENYKDDLEDIAIEITEDLYVREQLKFKYSDVYLDVLCGIGAIYNYVLNGKLKKKHIPSFNCIWDNRKDSQFGVGMRYWGFIEYATAAEWINRCPELATIPDAINQLQTIGNNTADNLTLFTDYYNNGWDNGLGWYNDIGTKNVIAGVKMFFVAPRDLRFKKGKYDNGKNRIDSIKDVEKYNEESGDYFTNAIHTCTLIGNNWTVGYGYEKNVLRDFYNKGEPVPNMSFFIPGMKMGQPRPVMSIVKKNQDEIDRLGNTLRNLQSKDYGKIPIVNAAVMGEGGKDAISFADDLKNVGVLVARTSADFLQLTRDMKAVEVVDLSNNSNLIHYLELKREEERQQEEYVGLSKAALGQQKGYISGQVQSQSAAYGGNIMASTVKGFFEFIARDLQYSMNVQKMLIGTGKDKDGDLVIGTKGVKLVKALKERRFEDLLLRIKIQDTISDQDRSLLLSWGQMWAADSEKSGIDADDLLMLISEKSISQMIRKLQRSIKRKKMDGQKQQAYQQQIELMQQQQMLASQDAIEAKKAYAKLLEKLESINLQGAWNVKEAEVKNSLDTKFQIDDAIIQNTISKTSQSQQAAQPQPTQ